MDKLRKLLPILLKKIPPHPQPFSPKGRRETLDPRLRGDDEESFAFFAVILVFSG
jgi:hypothetical protein